MSSNSTDFTGTRLGSLCDKSLATVLVVCTLLGVPGNSLSLRYFCSKQRKDVATVLYISICSVDIASSVAHFPVMLSLFTDRAPGLFNSQALCCAWPTLFLSLQKISMFLVMLLSVSRTISIAFPFYEVLPKRVMGAFVVYSCLIVAQDVMDLQLLSLHSKFSSDGPYCYGVSLDNAQERSQPTVVMSWVFLVIEAGVPVVVIFFSFVFSTFKLLHPSGPDALAVSSEQKRASVTVAMFTALFLFCNTPYFVNVILTTVSYAAYGNFAGPVFSNVFMTWYFWTISKILFTVLNAALNPVLYYCRMSGFQQWVASVPCTEHSRGTKRHNLQQIALKIRATTKIRAFNNK